MVWHGMAWQKAIRHGMMRYGMAKYGTVRYGMVWCGVVWCGAVWDGTLKKERVLHLRGQGRACCVRLGARRLHRAADHLPTQHVNAPHQRREGVGGEERNNGRRDKRNIETNIITNNRVHTNIDISMNDHNINSNSHTQLGAKQCRRVEENNVHT